MPSDKYTINFIIKIQKYQANIAYNIEKCL